MITRHLRAMPRKLMTGLALILVIAALFAGCAPVQEWLFARPGLPEDWRALLRDVRAYEKTLGFRDTQNFALPAEEQSEYTLCGYAPRLQLPYSYEDPLIRWGKATNEAECQSEAQQGDYYFARIEAVGEIGVPVTPALLDGKLDRFLYLVTHEDCHDQFDFPYGFEEALCNLIAYQGMKTFARQHYGAWSRNALAVHAYAAKQAYLTRTVVSYYGDTDRLYARHAAGDAATNAALQQRARLFAAAERTLGWRKGAMNNVGLANEMTYSRHYPLCERVFDALGGDLLQLMAFFKRVDREKPARAEVLARHAITDEKSAAAVMAVEASVADTTLRLLRGYNSGQHN